jgi:hypothetical protein
MNTVVLRRHYTLYLYQYWITQRRCHHPRLVVRVSGYWLWGPGFDSRFYHGDFSLKGKIPIVTTVWVVQWNLGLRPLLVLNIHISPSTSSGQRNCALWASQPQKSVTLRPQPGRETTKSIRYMWWYWKKIIYRCSFRSLVRCNIKTPARFTLMLPSNAMPWLSLMFLASGTK